MTDVNIFKEAARLKLRFETHVGGISAEQLFDLPLVHKSPMCLDAVAKGISIELKSLSEHSFVEVKPDPRRGELELKLEIVKDVIADKLASKATAEKRKENAEKRRQLLDALATRESQELAGKSKEELLKELEAIGD